MIIHSSFKDYNVTIYDSLDFLAGIIDEACNTLFVIDKNVFELYGSELARIGEDKRFIIEATEENKVIDTALAICEKMTEIPAKRNAKIIAIGGGIIQDICGFAASTLYRGIKWTLIPTTLLAACDSCIGGKTSLNYKSYKNLLGSFYPPDDILICPAFFKTLTEKDYLSGLGEVVKFNLMDGQEGIDNISNKMEALLDRDPVALNECVSNSLSFKKSFIEVDEFDRGERIKLNFAHTFGHAIETVTHYEIPHGTAVAIGMIMADSLSADRGLLSADTASRCEQILLQIIKIGFDFRSMDKDRFLSAVKKDKKQVDNAITAVLLTDNDGLKIVHDITVEEINNAVAHFSEIYY